MWKLWSNSRSLCRGNTALVCIFHPLTVLLFLSVISGIVFRTSLNNFSQSIGQTSSRHVLLNGNAPHLLPATTLCFVVENSRYLLNSNGFQIGHWGSVLTKILGSLDKSVSSSSHVFLQRVYVLFTDSVVSGKRLRSVEETAARSEYMISTLSLIHI